MDNALKKKLITVGIAIALAAGAWYTWQKYKGGKDDGALLHGNGRIEATEVDVATKLAGRVDNILVSEGAFVKAGQVLAQLDPKDYQLAADAARAQVASATTQRDLAAADLKRYQALKDQNFISGAELERREATLKAAQATLDQARAQLSSQGNQAAYTTLVADVSGVVTGIDAEPGQVVSAGAPVVRIAQDGPRDVVVDPHADGPPASPQRPPAPADAGGKAGIVPADSKLEKIFDAGVILTEGVASAPDGTIYFSDITFTP